MNSVKQVAVAAVIMVATTVGLAGTASADDYGSSTAPLGQGGAYLGSTAIDIARLIHSFLGLGL